MKTMYLVDFAEQRGVKPNTILQYIRDHSKEFEGHTWLEGNKRVIDEVAIELLEKKYPLPTPVVVIQNEEEIKTLKDELLKKTNELNDCLKELREADSIKLQLATAQIHQKLLESDLSKKDDMLKYKDELLGKKEAENEKLRASELLKEKDNIKLARQLEIAQNSLKTASELQEKKEEENTELLRENARLRRENEFYRNQSFFDKLFGKKYNG